MRRRTNRIAKAGASLLLAAAVCAPMTNAQAGEETDGRGGRGMCVHELLSANHLIVLNMIALNAGWLGFVSNAKKLNGNAGPTSGDFMTDPALDVYGSRSAVDNHLLNDDGYNQEIGAMLSGRLGEGLMLGVSVTDNRYKLDSNFFDYLQTAQTLDVIALFDVAEGLSLALGGSVSDIHVHADIMGNDSDVRYGLSALAMYDYAVNETVSVGLLAGVSSMNKENFGRTLDDDDTAGIAGVELDYELVEDLTANVSGTFFGLLDKEDDNADGEYVVLNAGLTYQATENVAVSVAYETVVCDSDSDENTGIVNVNISF